MDGATIIYDFDHHACQVCRAAARAHRVGQVLVDAAKPAGDFILRCTGCGAEDGPYAGPRSKDERDNWLHPPG